MPKSINWVQKFSISERQLEEWKKQLPPGEHLLHWCLINGKIDETEYLKWASRHFHLPVLDGNFFREQDAFEEWDEFRGLHPWGPSLLPLTQWEGVILLGCVEPMADLQLQQPYIFVLAPARLLTVHWLNLNERANGRGPDDDEQSEEQVPDQTFSAVIKGEHLDEFSKEISFGGLSFDVVSLSEGTHASELPPIPGSLPAAEVPEGLTVVGSPAPVFDTAPVSELDPAADLTPPEATVVAAAQPAFASDIPSGLLNAENSDSPVAIDFSNLQMPDPEPQAVSEAPTTVGEMAAVQMRPIESEDSFEGSGDGFVDASLEETPEEAATVVGKAPVAVTPPPTAAAPRPPPTTGAPKAPVTGAPKAPTTKPAQNSPNMELAVRPVPKMEQPTAASETEAPEDTPALQPVNPEISAAIQPQVVTPVTTVEQGDTYDAVANAAFMKMVQYYDHAMLLMFQGGQLRPWQWTPNWKKKINGTPTSIDLSKPSIFRIAFNTCLPYHGHVKPCPVNNIFFQEWFQGNSPSHVTLMPIMLKNQIGGMLMGLSSEPIVDFRSSLSFMEKLAGDVATRFDQLRTKKAA